MAIALNELNGLRDQINQKLFDGNHGYTIEIELASFSLLSIYFVNIRGGLSKHEETLTYDQGYHFLNGFLIQLKSLNRELKTSWGQRFLKNLFNII